ncbi:MAG TPA: VWA domain-containing protein [Pyrinomonadaceae bacterium]|nr:VWA domain-containing protein [Pyrinomonadaceae bacterium]
MLLALLALLCVAFDSHAQQQTHVLNVTVTNSKDRIVLGLKPEQFTIKADGVAAKIVSCEIDKSPITMGILFDVSGSIGTLGKQRTVQVHERLEAGTRRFLELSNPDNDYFLTPFAAQVMPSTSWTGSNTSWQQNLGVPKPGSTALYDAIYYGLEHVRKGRHSRRVLLIVSDGQDNNSTKTFKEVLDAIKRSDVTVFALGLMSNPDQGSALGMEGQGVLDELTKVSGGRAQILPQSSKPEAFKVAFENLANELQSQYRLSMEVERTPSPEKWRKLKLNAHYIDDNGRRSEARIRARQGFYR